MGVSHFVGRRARLQYRLARASLIVDLANQGSAIGANQWSAALQCLFRGGVSRARVRHRPRVWRGPAWRRRRWRGGLQAAELPPAARCRRPGVPTIPGSKHWRDGLQAAIARSPDVPSGLSALRPTFRGRPPLRPFSRAAAAFTLERACPPFAPSSAAIQRLEPRKRLQQRRHIDVGVELRPVRDRAPKDPSLNFGEVSRSCAG